MTEGQDYRVDRLIKSNYAKSLRTHIHNVQEAGKMINDKLGYYAISSQQLDNHDAYKWRNEEFPAYAQYFHGDRTSEAVQRFAVAWLHHIHHNPHHWQHWVLVLDDAEDSEYGKPDNGKVALEIPHHYALEMIADWMGASYTYTGSWDMTDWLASHWNKISMHDSTRAYMRVVLESELGYKF